MECDKEKTFRPFYFQFLLNDLGQFLISNRCCGINVQYSDQEVFRYFTLLVLFYADYAILLSNNGGTLQQNLNYFAQYCKEWR